MGTSENLGDKVEQWLLGAVEGMGESERLEIRTSQGESLRLLLAEISEYQSAIEAKCRALLGSKILLGERVDSVDEVWVFGEDVDVHCMIGENKRLFRYTLGEFLAL